MIWTSNNKVLVTRELFTDRINEVFAPSVKKYLLQMNLPLHALLIMDNAPVQPPDLQDDLYEEFKFIKSQFLPTNTTPSLQPMDQQVISNFKKLYTKALFKHCFEKLWLKSVVECDFEESETVSEEPEVNKILSFAKIMGLKMDKNDIHEPVEEQNQEFTTEELVEFQCASQQDTVEESLSEEVIVKQQSSSTIRKMLKAWETAVSYIEKA
ncbi:hypothetical protein AVEN_185577-1 [Araneus ventricosus]|uniref:DDE-1 domain-containing protein n=1 Tax=Araneus ventricosus TaxID=182803 RepID=A0A4Y2K7L1_ARAVE|nr:hypothetical protein AVEN_185577-1 [Araneus ventricosus]